MKNKYLAGLLLIINLLICFDTQAKNIYLTIEDKDIAKSNNIYFSASNNILSNSDIKNYKKIFNLQEKGKFTQAQSYINKLDDKILLGYVEAQKYMHPTAYRSKHRELKAWLKKYNDHPEARRIYKLAVRKGGKKGLRRPVKYNSLRGIGADGTYTPWLRGNKYRHLSKVKRNKARKYVRYFRRYILRGYTKSAKRILNTKEAQKLLTKKDYYEMCGVLGFQYFIDNHNNFALEWASKASDKTNDTIGSWAAGLAAWKLKKYDISAKYFNRLTDKNINDRWLKSAAAYWAYRANIRNGEPEAAIDRLHTAAKSPRTFYGIIARYTLGLPLEYDWNSSVYLSDGISDKDYEKIKKFKTGKRAFALLEVGDFVNAEREFRNLYNKLDNRSKKALMILAEENNMPSLALRISNREKDEKNGVFHDNARYPMPNWEPKGGWEIDKALIYAFVRQESGFMNTAKSSAGARGVMQLMPSTAAYIGRNRKLRYNKTPLNEIDYNLSLGQKYIKRLMRYSFVDKNIFYIAASYNAGPGNLLKWKKKVKAGGDPLLFIESLPAKETRVYIERIMTNLWIYRSRMNQDTPSLEAIARGNWPEYSNFDNISVKYAKD